MTYQCRIDNFNFRLSDEDRRVFDESGVLPAAVIRMLRATGWTQVAVNLHRNYNQVSYEAIFGCVGHTYYGLEDQNQAVNPHRLRVQAALAAALVSEAGAAIQEVER